MQKFVNREEELEIIRDSIKKGALIIVYGRRRIGKTRLLIETTREFKTLYNLCMEEEPSKTLKRLNLKLFELFKDEALVRRPVSSFEEFFGYIADKELVLVFDEFPILVRNYPKILGLLQEFWDFKRTVKNSVILCGSSISRMDEIQSYKSPIYGRRTQSLKVQPLNFKHVGEFFPEYSIEDLIKTYAVLDGIPEYLLRFDPYRSFFENIRENFFKKGFLYEEAEHLLRYELRDLSTYNTILEAIAFGYRSFSEIKAKTGLDGAKLSRYLSILENLGLIRREIPITLTQKEKVKKRNTLYQISDNYFNFYYSFIYPLKEEIEIGLFDESLRNFERNFNRYLGFIFEKVAKEFLVELNKQGTLPFRFTKIGRWWKRGEEIDMVALNERKKKALFVEVKWKNLSFMEEKRVLRELKRKAELVKELKDYKKHFTIVAKHIEGKEKLGTLTFDLKDLESHFL
jgi:hypothetical protein